MTTRTQDSPSTNVDVEPGSFSSLLRRLRLGAGLSQDSLAARSGLSRDAIAALERGRRTRPRADTVGMLADALGLVDGDRTEFLTTALSPGQRVERPPENVPPRAATSAPTRTSLIGREEEVAALLGLLETSRLVTMIGPGGIGKTRLALAVLDRSGGEKSFVDLSAVRDSQLVAGMIGARHDLAADARIEEVVHHLRDRRMLLLLDNFEQVVDAALLVATLVEGCPGLRVLITSRIALQLRLEQRFPVPPLAVPDEQDEGWDIDLYPAVRLFLTRAEAVHPSFKRDPATIAAVGTICRKLDGLPLAIELAASRVRILPPQSMLDRLGNWLDVLTRGAHDLPDRQRTLRATLDWSHDLLTDSERELFASLGAFEGGATIEAIEATCLVDQGDVVSVLESLMDKSLITQSEDSSGRARIGMLQMILEYAQEKLDRVASGRLVRRRHAQFYLALAERVERGLTGPGQTDLMVEAERELGNLRLALRWSLQERESDLAIRFGSALARFWKMSAHLVEGRRWLDEIVKDFLDDPDTEASNASQGRLLREAAILASTQTDFDAAQALGRRSLECMQRLNDDLGIADTLNILANAARNTGRLEEARSNYTTCLEIYRRHEDQRGIAVVLNNMGTMAWIEGDFEQAAKYQEESLPIRRDLGDTWGIANTLSTMAEVAYERERFAEAEAMGAESLSLRRKLGDVNGQALALDILSGIAQAEGNLALARERHSEAIDRALEAGNEGIVLTSAEGLAVTAALEGQILEGARLLGAVEALDMEASDTIPHIDEIRFRRAADKVKELCSRAAVDSLKFDAAWAIGRTFTFDRLAEEARSIARKR